MYHIRGVVFRVFIATKTMLTHDESMGGISLDDQNTFNRFYYGGRNYLAPWKC